MDDPARIRLSTLQGYLAADPDNVALLIETTEAALAAPDSELAASLVQRLQALRPDSFEARYFGASLAMLRSDFAGAIELLDALVAAGAPANARFNLAWSNAMVGDKTKALSLLAPEVTGSVATAAMLRTQLLHEAGEFEAALEFGQAALAIHPDDAGLNAAMAILALDLEDLKLAQACAARAGNHPEALAAVGILEMQAGDPASARASFDRSLEQRQHNPRAWIGRGLTALISHDPASAARDIDRGAQQFGDHIGSWIAAGWAHYLANDSAAAAQRFERALAIDPNFAESHGSLAVTDLAQGDRLSAERRMVVARKLDPECFSATLAKVLLETDNPERGRALIERAFATPLNAAGMTIASYMAGLAKPTVH